MAETFNNIAKIRKQRGLSQQRLAEMVGAHAITISNLERGQTPLTEEWMTRLSDALRVDEAALLKMERPLKIFVGAELTANRLLFWETERTDNPEDEKFAVAIGKTPVIDADTPRWAILRNDSLYPVFQEFDVVRLITILEEKEDEFLWAKRRLCIVSPHGIPDIFVGYLAGDSVAGRLKVNCIVGPPVTVEGAASIFVIDRAIYQPSFPEV